jgi:hypothetical protein
MKKHSKILAAAGALACAAVTVGQLSGQTRVKAPGGQPYTGGHVAKQVESGEPLRTMQGVISRHMCNVQNYLINKYGDDNVTHAVILAHCESQLTLRTRAQQQHEIYNVWDIGLWQRGNADWEAMNRVPSLINELLRVQPGAEAEVAALETKISDEFMKPLRDFIAREGLADVPREEANQRIYEWNQAELAKVPLIERSRRAVERSQSVIDFARTKLTKKQAAEMDGIIALFMRKMDAIEANAKKH